MPVWEELATDHSDHSDPWQVLPRQVLILYDCLLISVVFFCSLSRWLSSGNRCDERADKSTGKKKKNSYCITCSIACCRQSIECYHDNKHKDGNDDHRNLSGIVLSHFTLKPNVTFVKRKYAN